MTRGREGGQKKKMAHYDMRRGRSRQKDGKVRGEGSQDKNMTGFDTRRDQNKRCQDMK